LGKGKRILTGTRLLKEETGDLRKSLAKGTQTVGNSRGEKKGTLSEVELDGGKIQRDEGGGS